MILIRNARILDPVTDRDEAGDILIADGKIAAAEPAITDRQVREYTSGGDTYRVIDAAGMTAAPGLMDAHVHFRDPGFLWKEDLYTGSAAAARGGFTRVVCMANTKPVVDSKEVLEDIYQRAKTCGIHLLQAAAVSEGLGGTKLVPMRELADAGAVGFSDDGIPVTDEKLLISAMREAKKLGKPISLHEEDPLLIEGAGVNQGVISEKIGYGGAPAAAEEVMTARDCMLALYTGARVCIQHISSARSVEIVRMAKRMGADIHAEATPHHFTLTEEDVLRYGTNARMNPPLRTQEDRRAVIEGLRDGTIDMIVTDHAPHSAEEKEKPMPFAPSGIIGLETSLGLGILALVKSGTLSMMQLIRKMSTNPALFYRLEPASVRPGAPADLVLFEPDREWTVTGFRSKASNSPFLGWKLPGYVRYTICAGNIIYEAE